MAMFRNVLVPVDGSPPSGAALSLALAAAREWKATLTLCYAIDRGALHEEAVAAQMGDAEALIDADHAQGRSLLSSAKRRATRAGLSVAVELLEGNAAGAIVEFTKSHPIDLIVIGTHARGGTARLILGSTAEGVLRHSPVPVLTVRAAPPVRARARKERPDR